MGGTRMDRISPELKRICGCGVSLVGGLEDEAVFGLAGEWDTKLEELHERIGEFVEENVRVLGVSDNVLLEFLILDQSHVGGKHHQGLGLVVGELLGPVPLFSKLEFANC